MNTTRFLEIQFGWTSAHIKFLVQGPDPFVLLAGMAEDFAKAKVEGSLDSWPDTIEPLGISRIPASQKNAIVRDNGE